MVVLRRTGRYDVCCAKDLDRDFLYMLIFVSLITTGVFLYAFL